MYHTTGADERKRHDLQGLYQTLPLRHIHRVWKLSCDGPTPYAVREVKVPDNLQDLHKGPHPLWRAPEGYTGNNGHDALVLAEGTRVRRAGDHDVVQRDPGEGGLLADRQGQGPNAVVLRDGPFGPETYLLISPRNAYSWRRGSPRS